MLLSDGNDLKHEYLKKILCTGGGPSVLFIVHHVQNRGNIRVQELLAQDVENRSWRWIECQRLEMDVAGCELVVFKECEFLTTCF